MKHIFTFLFVSISFSLTGQAVFELPEKKNGSFYKSFYKIIDERTIEKCEEVATEDEIKIECSEVKVKSFNPYTIQELNYKQENEKIKKGFDYYVRKETVTL